MQSLTPESDEAIAKLWGPFMEQISKRLEDGKRDYGDRSFGVTHPELIEEIQQELLDVVGWSFILYSRLEKLREKVELLDRFSAR